LNYDVTWFLAVIKKVVSPDLSWIRLKMSNTLSVDCGCQFVGNLEIVIEIESEPLYESKDLLGHRNYRRHVDRSSH